MTRSTHHEPLLSEAEAAAMLGITKAALGRLRRAGRAPVCTMVGRFPKYARKHVLEHLARNARVPAHAR